MHRSTPFNPTALETLKQLIEAGPIGNRWYKVNLHVHGQGNDPERVVAEARSAEIDLLAVTDHQTFQYFAAIAEAAKKAGRPLTVLPGIEITTVEGVHILAVFPPSFGKDLQQQFLGWLQITGSGNTREASRQRMADILPEIDKRGGVVIVPHPKTPGIGMMDSARKLNIKVEWLESGLVRLMQAAEEYVRFVERDGDESFVNRYVLGSASPKDVAASTYCLAPFNRSDAHRPEEIAEGCSWFRMEAPTVDGLRQVACEPRTRISRAEPPRRDHDCIMGLRVSGGYCDDQFFRLNDGLNCVVGPNHAGKSAVFDFLRFGLGGEGTLPDESRRRLLNRLYGILGDGGAVEVFIRAGGEYYVSRRTFRPVISTKRSESQVESCEEGAQVYRFDPAQHGLVVAEDFDFGVEVYEQGRIGRLRDDVERQLEMLDEFARLQGEKSRRADVIASVIACAGLLRPLYEEREALKSAVAGAAEISSELEEKSKLIPDQAEEARWAKAEEAADALQRTVRSLQSGIVELPARGSAADAEEPTTPEMLFGQQAAAVTAEDTAEGDLLVRWSGAVKVTVDECERARQIMLTAVEKLRAPAADFEKQWKQARKVRQDAVRLQLSKAKVESPTELINRVNALRRQATAIDKIKRPRLAEVEAEIGRREAERERLLQQLRASDRQLTDKRREKAAELSASLSGQIIVDVEEAASTEAYEQLLNRLCDEITAQGHQIKNRKGQLERVIAAVKPLDLADALCNRGILRGSDGSGTSLQDVCGITENTQNVLCRIADHVELLAQLQTVSVPDVPKILVRRRGEKEYANLRTGLSPGEQSAAILAIALQTRRRPLIIDQPEDELGYSYVVHLVVPKILEVKGGRQILVISHNANIPVLGDADYVLKMENRPVEGGRRCVIDQCGCFESPAITNALLELDGGKRAFAFRQYRYALPR